MKKKLNSRMLIGTMTIDNGAYEICHLYKNTQTTVRVEGMRYILKR